MYREPFAGGKYIVNGDTPIVNEKQLHEFFITQVKQKPVLQPTELMRELIVHQVGGLASTPYGTAPRNGSLVIASARVSEPVMPRCWQPWRPLGALGRLWRMSIISI